MHRKIGGENGEMVEQGNGKIGRSIYDGNRKGNVREEEKIKRLQKIIC